MELEINGLAPHLCRSPVHDFHVQGWHARHKAKNESGKARGKESQTRLCNASESRRKHVNRNKHNYTSTHTHTHSYAAKHTHTHTHNHTQTHTNTHKHTITHNHTITQSKYHSKSQDNHALCHTFVVLTGPGLAKSDFLTARVNRLVVGPLHVPLHPARKRPRRPQKHRRHRR